jgi:endothelin-converting enzyme/putative endopeptidase
MALGVGLAVAMQLAAPQAHSVPTDVLDVDRGVDPCDDFYRFACDNWIKANPLPADQSRWTTFDSLIVDTRDKLAALFDDAIRHPAPASAKVAAYAAACMDEAGIEARGLAPVEAELGRIAALSSKADLAPLLAQLHAIGVNALFDFDSGADDQDPDRSIALLDQGGLGLPDRDYYLKDDAKSAELRAAYKTHVAHMLALAGAATDAADAGAAAIVRLETELATHALTRVQRRDPKQVYHKVGRETLGRTAPGFSWDAYLAATGAPSFASFNLREPGFVEGLGHLVETTPLDDLKLYLRWQMLHRSALLLPKRFVDEDFAFYGKVLQGKQENEPRARRCVEATDAAIGEALGKLYVERYFPPAAKERVAQIIADIRAAFAADIETLPWMGAETRKRAEEKLAAITEKLAYPDKWRDYSKLELSPDDALGNDFRAAAFEVRRRLAKIGGLVDKGEWRMTPPTVNAYYSRQENSINFPAGILQPPFFDPDRDEAENYGALGAVAGHEMTHGFDDAGRQFGPHGALSDWWEAADAAKFKSRTQCLVDQYGAMTVAGDVHVNGALTLGENTADNGGLRLALMALERRGLDRQELGGFDGRQRLFLAFGHLWCGSIRPEAARLRVATDPHSPSSARVNGTVSNMPEFAEAFRCAAGHPMVRETACRVW